MGLRHGQGCWKTSRPPSRSEPGCDPDRDEPGFVPAGELPKATRISYRMWRVCKFETQKISTMDYNKNNGKIPPF